MQVTSITTTAYCEYNQASIGNALQIVNMGKPDGGAGLILVSQYSEE